MLKGDRDAHEFPKRSSEMSDDMFLKKVKSIVVGEMNAKRIVRLLVRDLGFCQEVKGKHYHLRHPRLGNYKATMSCSPSDWRWGMNLVSQIRHAMWSANGR